MHLRKKGMKQLYVKLYFVSGELDAENAPSSAYMTDEDIGT